MRLTILLIFSLYFFSGNLVTKQVPQQASKNISAIDFKNQLNSTKNFILLDVRTPDEFAKGYVPGAININFFDKNFKEKVAQLPATKPVYVYCAVGGRSAKASALLAALNHKEIYNLEGGFTAWQKLKFPVQK